MTRDTEPSEEAGPRETLDRAEAVRVVAASARRLLPLVSEQQARDLASVVLRDLEAAGIHLVREPVAA